jgi:hypothetical protein
MRCFVALVLLLTALSVIDSALAVTGSRCSGKVAAGDPHGIALHASNLRVRHLRCRTARHVVLSYLRKKLNPSETCAALAENPPFSGCKVGRYRCRRTALMFRYGTQPEECSWGGRSIRFFERDQDNG